MVFLLPDCHSGFQHWLVSSFTRFFWYRNWCETHEGNWKFHGITIWKLEWNQKEYVGMHLKKPTRPEEGGMFLTRFFKFLLVPFHNFLLSSHILLLQLQFWKQSTKNSPKNMVESSILKLNTLSISELRNWLLNMLRRPLRWTAELESVSAMSLYSTSTKEVMPWSHWS